MPRVIIGVRRAPTAATRGARTRGHAALGSSSRPFALNPGVPWSGHSHTSPAMRKPRPVATSGPCGVGSQTAGDARAAPDRPWRRALSMGNTTSGIRNIALVGQAGAGKTSLVETLLLQAGATRARGSLARGTTVSDFDPQERRLQHSLDTTICSFDCHGIHVNLIDTPGYPDFLGKTLSVLEAVEAVAIVVSAVSGVDTLTQRLMEFARERELCRLVIVNKIDSRDARCADVLAQLREAFGPECLPLNLPSGGGDSVVRSEERRVGKECRCRRWGRHKRTHGGPARQC